MLIQCNCQHPNKGSEAANTLVQNKFRFILSFGSSFDFTVSEPLNILIKKKTIEHGYQLAEMHVKLAQTNVRIDGMRCAFRCAYCLGAHVDGALELSAHTNLMVTPVIDQLALSA